MSLLAATPASLREALRAGADRLLRYRFLQRFGSYGASHWRRGALPGRGAVKAAPLITNHFSPHSTRLRLAQGGLLTAQGLMTWGCMGQVIGRNGAVERIGRITVNIVRGAGSLYGFVSDRLGLHNLVSRCIDHQHEI